MGGSYVKREESIEEMGGSVGKRGGVNRRNGRVSR